MKIDRAFFLSQVEKPMFPVLIKNIREYCDRVVVEGLENARLIDELSHAGIWAVQGIFSRRLHLATLKHCYLQILFTEDIKGPPSEEGVNVS